MIKSYLLNNLFVPLRQISPSMLFASAALHSVLFVVPIPSNSADGELIKSANSPDEDTTKVSKDICDEDASLNDELGGDSLGEDASLDDGAGEDSLSEEILEGAGEDSLSEEIIEGVGEDSLSEEILEGAGEDSLSEEILEENTTSKSKEELCDDTTSLPKGKEVKIPKETPLLSDLENGGNGEEIENGDDEIPDLASGDSLDESGGAIDEIPTPTDDFSGGEDELSLEESPIPSENLSPSEPESEPEIAFTPSEEEELIDDTLSEPVEESTDDTVSETVDEPADTEVDKPQEETETESNPEETPSETDNQPQPRRVDPFAEFPNYLSVKPNFCGVKSAKIDRRTRVTSDPLDSVQAYFEKKLADTEFQVEKLTDRPDTKVYQVTKGNLTQFLQLFAVEEQGTMILFSSQRVDCYRLSNESQPEKPKTEEQTFDATFQNLYAQLSWTEEKDFVATSEVEKIFGKDTNNTPDKLALLVKSKLESEGFETSQVDREVSGILYEVKKGEFTKYISFVPIKEGKGAIILALKNSP
ncbi:MAG: hypothetical protein WBA39_12415 [Rivularia sp. (in: cyanobacteria)]